MIENHKPETIKIINYLFKELVTLWPAYRLSWPTEQEFKGAKRQWVIAFQENGLSSIEALNRGLKRLRRENGRFVLTPGAFIELCKPQPTDIGAPVVDEAYKEACLKSHPGCGTNKRWSHIVVQYAANRVGTFELANLTRDKTYAKFKAAYEDACNQFSDGKILNQIEQHEEPPHDQQPCDEAPLKFWENMQKKLIISE